jgi:hypothetical protein
MSLDLSKVVGELGEEMIAQAGEPLGLSKDQSVRVARALAANFGQGSEAAIKAAAEDTGLDEEVVAAMLKKLVEMGKEKLMEESGVNDAIDNAKDQAMAALSSAGGGLLGGFFKKK